MIRDLRSVTILKAPPLAQFLELKWTQTQNPLKERAVSSSEKGVCHMWGVTALGPSSMDLEPFACTSTHLEKSKLLDRVWVKNDAQSANSIVPETWNTGILGVPHPCPTPMSPNTHMTVISPDPTCVQQDEHLGAGRALTFSLLVFYLLGVTGVEKAR